jgi:hypothetical protein
MENGIMDDVLSSFLVRLVFKVDDPSKKHFDETVASVEKRVAALGAAAAAAATGIGFAVKKISENLGELFYAAQAAQSSAKDMNAFGFAIEQAGGKAGEGAAELKTFTDYIKSTAGIGAFANWFKVPFDVAHPVNSLMVAIDQLSAQYAKGGAAQATAIQRAQLMGISPDELIPDRVAKMHKAFDAKLKETGWIDDLSKKSAKLNADFNAITTHLKEMAEQASGPLMGAMSGLLEKTDTWLVRNKDWLVAIGTTQAKGIVEGINTSWEEFAKIVNGLNWLVDKIMEVVGDAGGKGVKALVAAFQALEPLAKQVGNAMHAAMEWAMKPLQVIIDALRAMGLISPAQASTGGSAGDLGGSTGAGTAGAGGGGSRNLGEEGWWTPERQKHAYDKLIEGGLSDAGAKGLISRWVNVEATGGPTAENAIGGGHYGIAQWSHSRAGSLFGNPDFDAQLDLVVREVREGKAEAAGAAAKLLREAKTPEEGALAASAFERAEGYNSATHRDVGTDKTLAGIARVGKAIGEVGKAAAKMPAIIPGQGDPHKPAFDPKAVKFHDFHPELHSLLSMPDLHNRLASLMGKPLGTRQLANSEAHDHRVVNSNVAVNVKGNFPVDKTERPLERPKLATLIRNTTAFAS